MAALHPQLALAEHRGVDKRMVVKHPMAEQLCTVRMSQPAHAADTHAPNEWRSTCGTHAGFSICARWAACAPRAAPTQGNTHHDWWRRSTHQHGGQLPSFRVGARDPERTGDGNRPIARPSSGRAPGGTSPPTLRGLWHTAKSRRQIYFVQHRACTIAAATADQVFVEATRWRSLLPLFRGNHQSRAGQTHILDAQAQRLQQTHKTPYSNCESALGARAAAACAPRRPSYHRQTAGRFFGLHHIVQPGQIHPQHLGLYKYKIAVWPDSG